ncbi:MAG TPA: serine hydrolase [Candidatus Limnocylindrales bacterium]|nr:serine hydrolase [Candidatus Limnocylindrales bacterium]
MNISLRYQKLNKKGLLLPVASIIFLAVQFGVPSNRVMPRTEIDGRAISWQSISDLRKDLANRSSKVRLQVGDKHLVINSNDAGLYPQVEQTVAQLPTISRKDRLVPLKPVYKMLAKTEHKLIVARDESKVESFSHKISKIYSTTPLDATAAVQEGVLKITKDKPGVQVSPSSVEGVLKSEHFFRQPSNTVPVESIPVKIKEETLLPLKQEFEQKTTAPLKVVYGNTTKTLTQNELTKLVSVTQDPASGKHAITYNPAAAGGLIDSWAQEYNVSPGVTQIAYHDDIEVRRSTGASGRALDVKAIHTQLAEWFGKPSAEPVVLAHITIAPTVVASRTFSRSSAQLQEKLNAWIASHSGRYQVAIRELNGRGREASHKVAQQTVMASTYKTFLAFVAYKQAEGGGLNLGTVIHNGRTIEQCIEVMIVNSDNDCAVKLGRYIGWAKADQIIASSGFEGIVLNNYDSSGNIRGDKLVNAREQAKFLAQLSAGSLINSKNSGKLIDYMKRQTYRSGIPAGSRGAPVADKVGFLNNYLHDVGIVYGPKATYALVIMSEGSSWTNIKDLSQAVYDFMNE